MSDPTRTEATPEKPVVVYICGSGRSGSTLLDRMLGQASGVVAVGELAEVWRPGELDKLVCGCGEPVRACPFWSKVADRAYGGWDTEDFRDAVALRPAVTRHRFLPMQIVPASRRFREQKRRFSELVRRTYDAIGEVSGVPVVVDSSKEVAFAYLLASALGSRLRLVHLVRNGNGVAYSWTKEVIKPEMGNPQATLARYRPARMAARWVGYNLLIDGLRAKGVASLPVRYESLVLDPRAGLRRILEHAGSRTAGGDLDFVQDRVVQLEATHTVAGNPMRFKTGRIELRVDEAWRQGLRRRDRWIVTTVASPLLLRFGYLGSRDRRQAASS